MLRIFSVLSLAAFAASAEAQQSTAGLFGRIENDAYVSPTGAFKVAIPVVRELGGSITDTDSVVTFQDDFSTFISIGAFSQDATQRWELSTRGLKDYLIYFLSNFVLPDFRRAFPGTKVELNARFAPVLEDGSLIAFTLIPGGSMFADKVPSFLADPHTLVAKRANMMFAKNGFTFVVSTELAERITERTKYTKTSDEEDDILRARLTAIVAKIQFTPPAPAPASATTSDSPAVHLPKP